jgi:hypothetical protein
VPLGLPTNVTDQLFVEAFRKGLRDVGLVENRDVTIDIAWVANESDYSQAVARRPMGDDYIDLEARMRSFNRPEADRSCRPPSGTR